MNSKPRRTPWAWLVATVFGTGFLKPGPGTYGSCVAVAGWYVAIQLTQASLHAQVIGTIFAAIAVTIIGIPASTIVAREAGRKDPGFVVVDEVAGQWIALIAMPHDPAHALLALVLFRVLDITKPWPIRRLEALPEGTGIMLDDVAAGLIALALGHLASMYF